MLADLIQDEYILREELDKPQDVENEKEINRVVEYMEFMDYLREDKYEGNCLQPYKKDYSKLCKSYKKE